MYVCMYVYVYQCIHTYMYVYMPSKECIPSLRQRQMMMMMMRYRLLSNSTEACLQLLPLGETLNFHSFLIATTLLPITTTTRRTRTRTRTRRCSLPSLSSSSSSSSSPPPPSSHRPWHLLSFHTSASPRGRYIPLTDVEKDSVTTDTEKCSVFEQLSSDDSENEVEGEKNVAAHLQKVEVEEYLVVNLVYDNSLDNQHRATRKFARRWFGPYVVTGANDNGTYHLAELDGTRMAIPVVGKRIKAFKKRHDGEPDLGSSDDRQSETEEEPMGEEPEPGPVFSNQDPILAHTGGCAVRWGRMS